MAFALVGSFGTVATSSGTTLQPTFAQATSAGNLLVGVLWHMATGAGVPSVDQGWSFARQDSGTGALSIAYKANCASSETAPTFSFTSNITQIFAAVGEFSGGDTTSPADQTGGTKAASTPQTATAGTVDTTAGELILIIGGTLLSKAGTDTTTLASNNGTVTAVANNDASSTISHYRIGYVLTSTSKAAADNATITDNSMNMTNISVALASFKLAVPVFAQPCNLGNSPGLLMEHERNLWRPRRPRIWRPEVWLPMPALS